jgi:septal ring factor EnvC (AmiA/AmiB activator)
MTDDQIWTLFWTVVSYAGAGVGTVAFATWWLKEQLTNSQIKGLEKENAAWQAQIQVVEERRKLAEDRLKDTAEKLASVTAKLEELQAQVKEDAPKEALTRTLQQASASTQAAVSSNNSTVEILSSLAVPVSREPVLRPTPSPRSGEVKLYTQGTKKRE